MKIKALIFLFLLYPLLGFTQTYKFRAIEAAFSENGEYHSAKSSKEIITIDLDRNRLTIFDTRSHEYSIKSTRIKKDSDGATHIFFSCLDDQGSKYLFDYLTYISDGVKRLVLTITFNSDTPDPDNFWMYVLLPY
ncbi:hypothetical protein [Runella zeae]|uniref:hypothetical protein n=1 Tax=Runella zeae TaxID=94255 RepID=UPI0023528369|nr:hypothetical protein [Runella zeae]